MKLRADQLQRLIDLIEADQDNFQVAIERRIAMFTPPLAGIHLQGYIVAAGDGGGYAFGATDFYLNVGIIDELIVAKNVTTHELYHAIQGAFAKSREAISANLKGCRVIVHQPAPLQSGSLRNCTKKERLLR